MTVPLDQASGASLPPSALAALADLRREPGITVKLLDDRAWVRWRPGDEAVLRRILPLPGVEVFALRDEHWYRPGDHLPSFGLPFDEGGLSLPRAVTPLPVRPTPPEGGPPVPARLGLVRDDRARVAGALRCGLGELGRWAEMATTARLSALSAAVSGDQIVVLGKALPPIAGAERFGGPRLFAPLGYRPDPDLPEPTLLKALGAGGEELVVLERSGYEVVPRRAFRVLTRAGVRLARGGLPA